MWWEHAYNLGKTSIIEARPRDNAGPRITGRAGWGQNHLHTYGSLAYFNQQLNAGPRIYGLGEG